MNVDSRQTPVPTPLAQAMRRRMEQHPRVEAARLVLMVIAFTGAVLEVLTFTGVIGIAGPSPFSLGLMVVLPVLLVALSTAIWPLHEQDRRPSSA